MPLGKEHKARSRRAILDSAGHLFRSRGYESTSIDDVMGAAGLTRGAFYAHFASKEALFGEVLGVDHGLIRMMRARKGSDRRALRREAARLLGDYLAPEHLAEVGRGCTLAALPGDAVRAGRKSRAAYAEALASLIAEFERSVTGRGAADRAALAVIVSVGAVILARACAARPAVAHRLLRAAGRAVAAELRPPSSPARRPPGSRR